MTMTTVVTSITSQPPQVLWRSWCSCGLPKVRRVWARGGEAGPASCGTGFSHVIVTLCWCVSSSPHICRLMKRSLLCFYQLRLPRNGQNLSEIFIWGLHYPVFRRTCCWCFSFIIFTTSQIPRLPWQWVGEPAWFTTCFSESSSHWPTAALSLRGTLWYQCFMYFVFTCIVLYCISHTNLLTPGKKETINISAGKNLDGWVGHHLRLNFWSDWVLKSTWNRQNLPTGNFLLRLPALGSCLWLNGMMMIRVVVSLAKFMMKMGIKKVAMTMHGGVVG